jgi:hypothetical protein
VLGIDLVDPGITSALSGYLNREPNTVVSDVGDALVPATTAPAED